MKAYMYHYVREALEDMPKAHSVIPADFREHIQFAKPLNKKEIENTLDELKFGKEKNRNSENDKKGCIFTFDDGIKDNFDVAKQLEANNSSGIFFITSKPYEDGEFLDVHMIHYIVYQNNLNKTYDRFINLINNNNLLSERFYEFKNKKSEELNFYGDVTKASEIKIFLNRFFPTSDRSQFLRELMDNLQIEPKIENFYLTKSELKKMEEMGMIIGGHTHSHQVMSKQTRELQRWEIQHCKRSLSKIIKSEIRVFSYPYGRKSSYNNDSLQLLKENRFDYAFTVEDKELEESDNKYELARYNCNYLTTRKTNKFQA